MFSARSRMFAPASKGLRFRKCLPFRQMQLKVTKDPDIKRYRNIGIIAHIDAGKTTTSERMLYYSGFMRVMGEVHDGDTVMDYMPQERERGITITSAAITLYWKKHKINLIDTPGHVDFTIEVERSLCALDGGIVILDSSAGVEVQTMTVWNQANRYNTPCIAYLNKMDKNNADFNMALESMKTKLKVKPLVLQLPIGQGKTFNGVIDIVSMKKLVWNNTHTDKDGCNVTSTPMTTFEKYPEVSKMRNELIETVADLDDTVGEKFILEGPSAISTEDLYRAIRSITLKKAALPVLCGSSYKNIGVQPLMDAVALYLPSPEDRFISNNNLSNNLIAFVFKITHNKKGVLTFIRIYSGSLKTGQKVYNMNCKTTEKIASLMIPLADDFEEVPELSRGNIAVTSGLNSSVTGDVLISSSSCESQASETISTLFKSPSLFRVPDPVFFCTIEPPSLGAQKTLEVALDHLQKEDPTFQVEKDEELGQTIISGMGELHIEIMKERILKEYGVGVYLGPLQVAYRETTEEQMSYTYELNKNLNGVKNFVRIMLNLKPVEKAGKFIEVNVMVTKDNDLGKIRMDHLRAINHGVSAALNNGPILGFPVIGMKVSLLWLEISSRTSIPMVSAAASHCVHHILRNSHCHLLEPIMKLAITAPTGHAGRIISDLSQKRSQILNVEPMNEIEVVTTCTPLVELRGYSTSLRALTGGTATFTMEFETYQSMNSDDQAKAVQEITGFV